MSEKKEYIERGALKDKFRIPDRESVFNLVIAETPTIEAANIATDMIIEIAGALRDAVDDEPAADVEPVVRGEWTMLTADLTDWSRETYVHWLKCSLCGKAVPLRFKSKFCPHCGAHMVERQCAMPFKPQSVEEEKKACADYFERAERSGSGE